jgi:hypothetical protein
MQLCGSSKKYSGNSDHSNCCNSDPYNCGTDGGGDPEKTGFWRQKTRLGETKKKQGNSRIKIGGKNGEKVHKKAVFRQPKTRFDGLPV